MSANTTSPITPLQAVPADTVSWPSLFFGLRPFAINSMTQPAGMVCGADADVGFLLRSSPIMCIIDALLILYDLFSTYFTTNRATRSYQTAHTEMIQRRFQSEIYEGFKESKRRQLHITRTNEQVFRVVAFLLSVTQLIKLFGYGNLVWSKVIAALYLASFLVIEMLVVWPVARKMDIEDTVKNQSAWTEHTSAALAVVFLLYFASVACRDIVGQPHHTLLQWGGIVIGGLGAVLAVPAMGYSYRHRQLGTWREVGSSGVLLVVLLGTPVGFYFAGRIIPESMPAIWVKVVCAVVSVVWGGIGLLYASETTKAIRLQPEKVEQRKKVEQVAAWYFLLLHLATALLYYMFSYDPTGTVRPAWTEWLD